MAEPLYHLIKKNVNFKWEKVQEDAFIAIKKAIGNINFLSFFNPDETVYILADASPVGLGAVLLQGQKDDLKIISFASKTLTAVEKRYSQTEKEALALVWAVEKFHQYIFGKEFILMTDHKPLEFIFSQRSKPCARIERWVLRLQTYKFKVKYIPGKSNIADPFSRLFVDPTNNPEEFDKDTELYINEIITGTIPIPIAKEELQNESINDAEIKNVIAALRNNSWPGDLLPFKLVKDELSEVNGMLIRGTRILIPLKLRSRVLQLAHEGHPGICSMKSRLRTYVWWPKMDFDVQSHVKKCRGCQIESVCPHPEPMTRRRLPEGPWDDIVCDCRFF